MDLVLTGRPVDAREALSIGLANRVVAAGDARRAAESLAVEIAAFPQRCLRADRESLLAQWGLDSTQALSGEFDRGLGVLRSGESAAGAGRFLAGAGRGGRPAG
jgi:enoyl-CoA hydratase